ncbi:diaminopropionate ammonia-lyase [Cloacibacillus sp.]|uniref:diaminopropionate ammonia-lyase n=1 Tax=Cloacibacillus sp. TaxID=2049023 RepID=UPI0025BCDFEE|nr:diaminopropionate ammonia-lyase [Cloacibacillus sp.]MCC8057271.1 diaminopropionate ammonia-lyase [Cloacibacillus sp.]MCC8178277.1 diaminopropionate ammonia-lyase [Cloacibacillus sp.]
MNSIKWIENKMPKTEDKELEIMALCNVKAARAFHESFPQYKVTPLAELKELAKFYGIKDLFIKDESYRFGLNAFKVLGGSFAMARYISKLTGRPIEELTYDVLTSPELKKETGDITFFSATDGNHGRGVAWAANKLGQKSVIMMPKGSQKARFDNIRKEGAVTTIEEFNYDDCVRKAAKAAGETHGGVIVQDTAWEGYEEIPAWIMQGYGTMAMEADQQFSEAAKEAPSHVFVQAGVGSLAGAVVGYFANRYPENPPTFVVVESDQADCLYKSACAGDGGIRIVDGDMQTIMAGLACGEPNTSSWQILKDKVAAFVSVPDWVAANGMRVLGAPLAGDPRVVSGESGAAPAGFLYSLMTDESLAPLRERLGINEKSRILLFSTEGDTDPENYHRVVWDGACAKEL